jgi:hypothetical protein
LDKGSQISDSYTYNFNIKLFFSREVVEQRRFSDVGALRDGVHARTSETELGKTISG